MNFRNLGIGIGLIFSPLPDLLTLRRSRVGPEVRPTQVGLGVGVGRWGTHSTVGKGGGGGIRQANVVHTLPFFQR